LKFDTLKHLFCLDVDALRLQRLQHYRAAENQNDSGQKERHERGPCNPIGFQLSKHNDTCEDGKNVESGVKDGRELTNVESRQSVVGNNNKETNAYCFKSSWPRPQMTSVAIKTAMAVAKSVSDIAGLLIVASAAVSTCALTNSVKALEDKIVMAPNPLAAATI
jgi:hypothetical protein